LGYIRDIAQVEAMVADLLEAVLVEAMGVDFPEVVLVEAMVAVMVKDMEEDITVEHTLKGMREDLVEGIMMEGIGDIIEGVMGEGIMQGNIMNIIIMAEDIIMGFTDIAHIITRFPTMGITLTTIIHTQIIIMDTIQPHRRMA
jgi:hypothetical protein